MHAKCLILSTQQMLVEPSQIYAFSPSQMNYLTLLNICVMQNLRPCGHLPVFIHTQQSSVLSLHPLSSALIPFQISITAVPCHGDSESICACFPSFIPFPFALLLFSSIVFLSLSFVIQSLSFTPAFFLNIFKILYNHPPANDTLKLRN